MRQPGMRFIRNAHKKRCMSASFVLKRRLMSKEVLTTNNEPRYTMMKILKTCLLIGLILGVASVSFSQQPLPGARTKKMMEHRAGTAGWSHFIPDLTDQQKEQIRKIRLKGLKELLPLKNQLKEKRAQLRTLTTGQADMPSAYEVAEEIGMIQTDLLKKRLDIRQQIRELLTEDQRVIFDVRPGPGDIAVHTRIGGGKNAVYFNKGVEKGIDWKK